MIEAESPGGKFVQHMRRYMNVYGWTERVQAMAMLLRLYVHMPYYCAAARGEVQP